MSDNAITSSAPSQPPSLRKSEGLRTVITSGYLWAYLALYAVTLFAMNRIGGFDPVLPLAILAVLGVGLSALAWLATRGVEPMPIFLKDKKGEMAATAACLLPVIAFITWGLTWLNAAFPAEPWNTLVITGAKLALFVALPAAMLLLGWGYRLGELFPAGFGGRKQIRAAVVMSIILVLFQAALGRGLKDLQQAQLSAGWLAVGIPLGLLWAALEAGLVEEFFFRELLQTRLAGWLRSEIGAVVLMSLLFGLAHAPGFYLRGGRSLEGLGEHPAALLAFGYSIVVTSVAGFLFGILWARTRNLWLVALVHGAGDWLQSIVPFVRMWHH